MDVKTIVSFPGTENGSLTEVGGKGLSLIEGSKHGFPIPPGFVLTANFFSPWFASLKKTSAWERFLQSDEHDLEASCNELKKEAFTFSFTQEQEKALFATLTRFDQQALFAVRSSSPQEDLEGSSFAGGYETVLGVKQDTIRDAIKKAFASCLDYRVTVYKKEHGFGIHDPKIAVIVQEQISSEIAGVGFSLNPVTNNFDEAIITANFGLGESVVQGITTPDTFTMNKVSLKIVDTHLGAKDVSIWLLPNGGTEEKKEKREADCTLSQQQLAELTTLIKHVEQLYKKPMDIEWAFAKETLYLLQARPITAYIPLADDTKTKPNEKKRLYFDVTTTAQAMDMPISVIGVSSFRRLIRVVSGIVFLRDMTKDIHTSIAWVASNGRLYANLSNFFQLVGIEKVASLLSFIDPLAAQAIKDLSEEEYKAPTVKISLLPVGLVLKLPKILPMILRAYKNPEKIHQETQKALQTFEHEVVMFSKKEIPLTQLWDELLSLMFHHVFLRTVPLTIASRRAFSQMKKMAGEDLKKEVDILELALPHNVTTEMGLRLFAVASHLPENISVEALRNRLEKGDLPEAFITSWKEFLKTYGVRGPGEIDIASMRYRENPELLLDLMVTMRNSHENAQDKFDTNAERRKTAYDTIYQHLLTKHPKSAEKFASLYTFFVTFGGYRETHKYYLVFVVDILRQKVLENAELFHHDGRLAKRDDVFYLTLEDVDRASRDAQYDLIAIVEKNKAKRKPFETIHYPSLIDSRGFIPHSAPQTVQEGEVRGMAVSSGIARGKIKVLHSPSEKPLLKGEILVAKATDPGWTPLFVNASAVILEVGGMLQHGALVAREYGIPCVSGVENATSLWKDGAEVEVDGSAGTIREIPKS